jgi:ABC-2 type transport system ATP-binding protein
LLSEELTSLQGRFREVGVTCEGPAQLPTPWPEAWLTPETSGAVTRFVVTDYAEDRTLAQIDAMFPRSRGLSLEPMSLRSIFITLAKSRRDSSTGAAL